MLKLIHYINKMSKLATQLGGRLQVFDLVMAEKFIGSIQDSLLDCHCRAPAVVGSAGSNSSSGWCPTN